MGNKNGRTEVHIVKEIMHIHEHSSPFSLLYHNNKFINKEGESETDQLLTHLMNNGGKIKTCTSSHYANKIVTIWTIIFK